MTLAEIIERLEKATGPDREIDRAIVDLFGARASDIPVCANIIGIGAFTRSFDDARKLATSCGFYVRLEPRFHIDGERVDYLAYAIRPRWADYTPANDWFDTGEARHAEPAIAACLALCRALQAHGSSHD